MNKTELYNVLEQCTAKCGAFLIDLTIQGKQQKTVLELFIDSESGVTTELCSKISRAASEILEQQNAIDGAYDLVVSSPGSNRPLQFLWQYKKHQGRDLKLRVRSDSGVAEILGKLNAIEDDSIVIESGKKKEILRFKFEIIEEGTVQIPW